MLLVLNNKPVNPNEFDHFMDHAYFSSLLLFKKLFEENEVCIRIETLDALTAILMHNSLYKFNVARFKDIDKKCNIPFKCDLHPLAYMLMLCDELQCYDRIAYGRNSKIELHPFACDFDFSDNAIYATYLYDKKEELKIKKFEKNYKEWLKKKPKDEKPKLKAYSSMYTVSEDEKTDFQSGIEKIVDTSILGLNVKKKLENVDYENKNSYLSESNFINLYNFAVVLNGQWEGLSEWEKANQNGCIEEFLFDKDKTKHFEDSFKILWGTFAAISLFSSNYYGKLSFDRQVSDHEKMEKLYKSVAESYYSNDFNKKDLLKKLAKEEIVENAEWMSYVKGDTFSFGI